MRLFLLFLAVPLIEIALFIQIGGAIGLGWTLAIVVLTAVAGTWLVRSQGALALRDVQRSFEEMRDPSGPLAHGAMILFSGALLLTPGFFTDTIGFLLLVPAVRERAFRYIRDRVTVVSAAGPGQGPARRDTPQQPGVIDGDYEDVTPQKRPTHPSPSGPSGWTRH